MTTKIFAPTNPLADRYLAIANVVIAIANVVFSVALFQWKKWGFLGRWQSGVAVEKLTPAKIAEMKSRQDALQTIFSGRLDIFHPPNLP